jgi:hypothetical protein
MPERTRMGNRGSPRWSILNMMRRTSAPVMFLVASLALHGGAGISGVWLAHHAKVPTPTPTMPTFAGETFDIAPADDSPRETVPVTTNVEDERSGVAEVAHARPKLETHGDNHAAAIEPPLTYGALGDRSASSVIVAVSRGFPQAASTDQVWQTEPFGDEGSATLEIELAEDGSMARWSLGQGASAALRQAMVRTMSLIGSRTFIAKGAVTKLRISARVTADAVRDGTDAVYAIHSEHEGDTASAYFSLSSGRRIDLVIGPVR